MSDAPDIAYILCMTGMRINRGEDDSKYWRPMCISMLEFPIERYPRDYNQLTHLHVGIRFPGQFLNRTL